MAKLTKRTAATVAASGVLLGGLLMTGGVAGADPGGVRCRASDLTVTIVRDAEHASGHEAYDIVYTAASPATDCKLWGAPEITFLIGSKLVPDVVTKRDRSDGWPAVYLRSGNPAVSRIIQRSDGEPHLVSEASVGLPTATVGQIDAVIVAWPAGEPLKGGSVELTPVVPYDAN
jgi:hypothetical protein